jgi:hypothetical protein
MKTKMNVLNAIAITTTIALTSTVAMAHSNHDHSTVAYKWALSKDLQAKIDKKLGSAEPTSLIGLNAFEQKKLEHYDIKVGKKFNTETHGLNFLIERTSAGMKIVDANRFGNVAYTDTVPIKKIPMLSKVTMNRQSHAGHDHSHLPYEWTFGLKTQGKLIDGMVKNDKDIMLGLNTFELSLFKEYGIKAGNTFQTTVSGHKFLIEKTSAGIKVLRHVDMERVAVVPDKNENM